MVLMTILYVIAKYFISLTSYIYDIESSAKTTIEAVFVNQNFKSFFIFSPKIIFELLTKRSKKNQKLQL